MDINLEFDPSVEYAPAGFITAVQYAASYLDTLLTDPITVNIAVGYDEIGGYDGNAGTPITKVSEGEGGPTGGTDVTYQQLQEDYAANLSSATQAEVLANLPAADPSGGGYNFYISSAQEKAWGLLPADDSAIDGAVGFDPGPNANYNPADRNNPSTYDFVDEAVHELTHALGRIAINAQSPFLYSLLDLTRYASPGVLASASTAAPYFSINAGVTSLNVYDPDNGSDPADWAGSTPDSFDAIGVFGTENPVTSVDVTLMNALGFAVGSASPPPTSFDAGDETQLNDGLTAVNSGRTADTVFSVTLTGTIALDGPLVPIALPAGDTLVFNGSGAPIDGGGDQGGLAVNAGTVVLQNLAIQYTLAFGGNGTGGLSVGAGATVALQQVIFNADAAPGGAGAGGDIYLAAGGDLSMTEGVLTGGGGVFLGGGTNLLFVPAAGQTVNVGDTITDEPGATGAPSGSDSGTVFISGGGLVRYYVGNSYTGGTVLEGGATLDLLTDGALGGNVVTFGGSAMLRVEPGVSVDVPVNGFNAGGTIDVMGISDGDAPATLVYDAAAQVLAVEGSTGGSLDLLLANAGGDYLGNFVPSMDASGTGTDVAFVACFAEGTRILTAGGEVPVERIRVGEVLPTLAGRAARVRWLGRQRSTVPPVRIAAGAFGERAPHRALLLSPDHAVHVDGVLMPVRHLVSGAGIAPVAAEAVTYWHVELDRHAVVLAEGLACESYLDTGNRRSFAEFPEPEAPVQAYALVLNQPGRSQ